MASGSVDGLVSGLSTSDVINQLMQVESAGKTRLQNKVTVQQNVNSAFQSLNSKVANLKTAAAALVDPAAWKTTKATASSDAATVTTSGNAIPGEYTVTVDKLALAHRRSAVVASTGSITTGPVKITVGTTDYDITLTSQTAQGVADGINASDSGVKAALVSTTDGTVLQLSSAKTGEASKFTISGLNVATTVDVEGRDATLKISGGYTVKSATNTFTDAIPGVTLVAAKENSDVTVSVKSDPGSIADKIGAMVSAANAVLSDVKAKGAQPKDGGAGGALAGNFLIRTLAGEITGAVAGGVDGYGSLAALGIQTTRDGTLSFDRSKFLSGYQSDPAKAKAMISTGLAPAMQKVADGATKDITAVIQNGDTNVKLLNNQIEGWDTRLEMRRTALQKQFTNLEVALGKLKDQSSWLAGQISSLSANNG